ncbi:hypothetical protein MARPU_06385 [Marichromatium purpuratum 984]|uniref:Uncharacterized protein n=1 Tax=Marichromatium purpuratum 984 TaxID=765910 RepID=W0E8Q3_MARPU|nr:hypothetical protein MARPU_06385 [Marichromatium purpuratum 984]
MSPESLSCDETMTQSHSILVEIWIALSRGCRGNLMCQRLD